MKTTARFHITLVKMANTWTSKTTNAGKDAERKGSLSHCCWEGQPVLQPWGRVRDSSEARKQTQEDSATPLLESTEGNEMKWAYESRLYPVLAVLQFTMAEIGNQPRRPPTGDWRKKAWHACAKECYSAIKENEILSCNKIDAMGSQYD